MSEDAKAGTAPQLCTIAYFMKDMLGFKDKSSYYNHLDDEGWPQRVFPGGRPMLVYAECEAYVEAIKADRKPREENFVKAKAGSGVRADQPPKKRHTGRPAKTHPQA